MLGDVFSKVVEAVSEVARREEECRLVEDETEKLLSRRGGINHLQVRVRYRLWRASVAILFFVCWACSLHSCRGIYPRVVGPSERCVEGPEHLERVRMTLLSRCCRDSWLLCRGDACALLERILGNFFFLG